LEEDSSQELKPDTAVLQTTPSGLFPKHKISLVLGSVSLEGATALVIESLQDDFFVHVLCSPSREDPGQVVYTPPMAVVTSW
jgi:hypothetical protein